MINQLTPEERSRGLANVRKLRAELEKISTRKHFAKRNYIQRIKIKANQLQTITADEFDVQYGRNDSISVEAFRAQYGRLY